MLKNARAALEKCIDDFIMFHQKSMKNQAQKKEKRFPREKSMKSRFLALILGPRIDFSSILGFQRGPNNDGMERGTLTQGIWGAIW